MMLEMAGQTWQYLMPEDIETFPCEDLRIIDHLWVKFSDGRFGFSVQKKIYIEAGNKLDGRYYDKEYKKFANQVGWRMNKKWFSYHDFTFDTSARRRGHLPGHLPFLIGFLPGGGWRPSLFSRAQTCQV